jgi:hypothetical protein
MNGTAKYVASGSYNNTFRVFGVNDPTDVTLEASRDPMRRRLQQQPKQVRGRTVGAFEVTLCTIEVVLEAYHGIASIQ